MTSYDNVRKIAERFNLELVDELGPSSCIVYLVKYKDIFRVAKFGETRSGRNAFNQVEKESKVLDKLRHINEVPEKILYNSNYLASNGHRMNFLIKEYFEGEPLETGDHISDEDEKMAIIETVRRIHSSGVAGLDLICKENVIRYEGKVKLIDFGNSVLKDDQPDLFEALVIDDNKWLNELFLCSAYHLG